MSREEDNLLQGLPWPEKQGEDQSLGWHTHQNQKYFFQVVVIYFQVSEDDSNAQKYKNLAKMTQLESSVDRIQTKENWPPNMWPQPQHCHKNANSVKPRTTLSPAPITNVKSDIVDTQ